ncbi:Gfo/Idh/MocA family protein [Afifella sp. IM 167]|uniref:Gfo/Idh/MocA family protein n=1 Tax=Afifella sp. IM 167 TaxID=2033586 RepID=UPI001CCF7DDD|nr:Gfo/Idh/MocA family oxidoreductase [Afifella sp. IM 167]MBZ8134447.1 oxidoreductase [Afifella sp. IM 167]
MIRFGVIGYGYWGPNIARALMEVDAAAVHAIADVSSEALGRAGKRHPSVLLQSDWREVVADPAIDAIVVATPVNHHFEIALAALRAGKHVLVEKPMTADVGQAWRLVEEARRRSRVLMVDHTFVYTGAVQAIHGLIETGHLGDLYYYDSIRVNLGNFQNDVNVIWDLAAHDFAILDFLSSSRPMAISATAAGFLSDRPENMAHLSVYYEDGSMANLNVNWLAPIKVRQVLLGGSRRMVIYDDMETSEKVKVYDRGVTLSDDPEAVQMRRVSYRVGDMWAPVISAKEALLTELEHFCSVIETGAAPMSDGLSGLRVVEMLSAASHSMRLRGQPVEMHELRKAS